MQENVGKNMEEKIEELNKYIDPHTYCKNKSADIKAISIHYKHTHTRSYYIPVIPQLPHRVVPAFTMCFVPQKKYCVLSMLPAEALPVGMSFFANKGSEWKKKLDPM